MTVNTACAYVPVGEKFTSTRDLLMHGHVHNCQHGLGSQEQGMLTSRAWGSVICRHGN